MRVWETRKHTETGGHSPNHGRPKALPLEYESGRAHESGPCGERVRKRLAYIGLRRRSSRVDDAKQDSGTIGSSGCDSNRLLQCASRVHGGGATPDIKHGPGHVPNGMQQLGSYNVKLIHEASVERSCGNDKKLSHAPTTADNLGRASWRQAPAHRMKKTPNSAGVSATWRHFNGPAHSGQTLTSTANTCLSSHAHAARCIAGATRCSIDIDKASVTSPMIGPGLVP